MHELRQAPPTVQCDAAKVFSVDGCAYAVWNHGASPTCTHDGDQDISRPYGIAPELLVLLRRDQNRGLPSRNSLATALSIPSTRIPSSTNSLCNNWLPKGPVRTAPLWLLATASTVTIVQPIGLGGVAEHVEEGGLEEGVELGEGLAALGPQGVRRIQNPRNPLLLGERREGDLGALDALSLDCSIFASSCQRRNDAPVGGCLEVVATK